MRRPVDQADFFCLLAKLFNYIVSGKSHIGYMYNNPGNTLVPMPVRSLYLLIVNDRNRRFMVALEYCRWPILGWT